MRPGLGIVCWGEGLSTLSSLAQSAIFTMLSACQSKLPLRPICFYLAQRCCMEQLMSYLIGKLKTWLSLSQIEDYIFK